MMNTFDNPNPNLTAVDFDPFAGGELLLTAPATASQQEIWASVQMGSAANCAYNESQSLRLTGELDVAALTAALQLLASSHEALNTTFSTDGQTLCIAAASDIALPISNLAELSPEIRTSELMRILQQEVRQPFDLEHGPLWRSQLIKLATQEHLLILTAHHIICDGWSWGVLMPDLGNAYSALQQGLNPQITPGDKFSDYATEQQAQGADPETIETEAYWLSQFADQIPVVDFPTDRPRPSLRTFDAARVDGDISAELVTSLKQLASQQGCSLMTVLLAGVEVWLHRLTGQEDLVVGIPAAGQATSGQSRLVGHCVNLLPLRSQVDRFQSFESYLEGRKSQVLDAYEYQGLSFGSLLSKLALSRDASRIPLVPITFNLDRALEGDSLPFSGLEVEFFTNPRAFENFELFINATEARGKITLECQYNSNLFDAQTIEYRLAELTTLLGGIVANPAETIATLPILPPAELALLAAWNQTQTDYPQVGIAQLFEEQVALRPAQIAIVFGAEQLTYGELDQRASQLAVYLQSQGVGIEDLVGLCTERSVEMIVGMLGILKAGGAYVPIDPNYPTERLSFMLTDTQVKLILTQSHLVNQLPDSSAKVVCLDTDRFEIDRDLPLQTLPQIEPDNLACIVYTSGSTGQPKGVKIQQRGVVRLVKGTAYATFSEQEVFLQLAPLSFDPSILEIYGALLNGGKLVIFPAHLPSLDEIEQIIRQHQVNILWLTVGLFNSIVDEKITALTPIRQMLTGGDVVSVTHAQKFLDAVPEGKLINGYGPTECSVFSACYHVNTPVDLASSLPIGQAISNTQIYILDPQLQLVPIGIPGELYIGGDGLARGYLNRPELSAEKFIPNPFKPDTRLYKSGDLGKYLAGGTIEFLGRSDNQVKVSGFRIELGEIEIAMLQYPGVKEAVTIVRSDTPERKVLVGYFVPDSGVDGLQLSVNLRQWLTDRLPGFMVPTKLMALSVMPLTQNSKIDRRALPQPDTTRLELGTTYVAPTTKIEEQIAQVWAQVLNLDRVGIYDNFFELGGYSLLGIQVVSRLRQVLDVEILMPNLFQLPTVAALAERVETLRWAKQGIASASLDLADDDEEGEL